jgi:tripartite-type tricarboxylate transporter receptor subunit TctC
LLLHHIGMATSATLYRKLPYDPKTAFAPVGLVTEVPMILVARKDFPPNTLPEVITYVKEHKDEVTYANAGIGAASHLCGMLFMQAIETPMTTVPYKGTGPAMTDLLGGQVDLLCDQSTNTTGQIKGGEIKAYGVFADQRLGNLPDIPTVKEGGLEGLSFGIWHGLYAPAGTPEPIVAKLSEALKTALADPKVVERFAELGTAPVPADQATPAALQQKVLSEIDRWKPVIEKAGEYAD